MASFDDTTQRMDPPAIQAHGKSGNGNATIDPSHHTDTLPSIGFEPDLHAPTEVNEQAIKSPQSNFAGFGLVSNGLTISEYHEPFVSQSIQPDSNLEQIQEPQVSPEKESPQDQQMAVDPIPFNTNESIRDTSSNGGIAKIMELSKEEVPKVSPENSLAPTPNPRSETFTVPSEPSKDIEISTSLNKSSDSLEMEDEERRVKEDMEELNRSIDEAMRDIAAERHALQKAMQAPTTRHARKRKVSASQGVHYDYSESGTLLNDSDDEDSIWSQQPDEALLQYGIALGNKGGNQAANKEDGEESDGDEEKMVMKPPTASKKIKTEESENTTEHSMEDPTNATSENRMDLDEDSGKFGKGNMEADAIDISSDEEKEGPTYKPRAELGKLSTKKANAASSASPTASSSKHTDQQEAVQLSLPSTQTRPKRTRDGESVKKPTKGLASVIIEPPGFKTSRRKKSPSETPKKASSKEGTDALTNDDESVKAETETGTVHSTPSSTTKEPADGSPTPKKKYAKTYPNYHRKAEYLRRQTILNARASVAKYLSANTADLKDHYTQAGDLLSKQPGRAPPVNCLSGCSFVVTGIRSCHGDAIDVSFLKLQIVSLGGQIVNKRTTKRIKSFRGKQTNMGNLPRTILISEKPQRTLKYIQALIRGVPCVHYRWLLVLLHTGAIPPLEEYLLPAGYNEDSATVAIPAWMCQEVLNTVPHHILYPFLKEDGDPYRVEIAGSSEFKAQWRNELEAAGAMVVDRLHAHYTAGRIDYILSDSEPTTLTVKLAQDRGIPLCSIDWAIQSIIQRKIQDPFDRPAYIVVVEEIPE